ncbi:uncharacterized protein LOC143292907 [Babylonia areolata]|uniref:uncharacterized protein LOC143292907 n=1 Tax=Babylonia areolata TaxID=304850 RepID=UPI003FD483DE
MASSSMPVSSSTVAGSASSTPVSSSSTPVSISSTPVSSTIAGSASSTPASSSSTPVSGSSTPVSISSTLVSGSSTPVSGSSTPVSISSTPVSSTEAGSASSTPMTSSSMPVSSSTVSGSASSTPVSSSSTPVSSSSQSDVTSSSVTVTPPTTVVTTSESPASKPKIPTKPPNLRGAVFVLYLTVQVKNRTAFISDWYSETYPLREKFEAPFKNIAGFIGMFIKGLTAGQRGSRQKREAVPSASDPENTTEVEVGANFTVNSVMGLDQVQREELKENLTQAVNDLNTSYTVIRVDVDAFLNMTQDPCQAQGVELCSHDRRCVNGSCFHKCEFHQCSSHGQCYVQVGSPYSPQCRCVSDGVYDYSGPLCDDQALQARWVGAIVGGLSAVVLLVFVVAIVVYCCCRRQMKYKDDSSLESSSDDGYFRHSVAPRYETGYDNTSFQREGTADRYYPTRGAARYHSNPESLRADRPWFRRLPETFVIERPQVFLYRQPHPGWSS